MRRGALLEGFGIWGCGVIEDAVVAAVSLSEPLLLVGGPGTAKTSLAMAVAQGLRMRAWAYDASKAMFEDIVGFPSPRSLADGHVEYVPTDLSLWDKQFILVDELSRAQPSLQNKWLEVIRSRRLMGMPLRHLQVVVAAMNPPGLPGTTALDPALAGRFTYVVEVPEVHDMTDRERDAVIRRRGPDDGFRGDVTEEVPDLRPLAARVRAILPAVEAAIGPRVRRYVERVRESLLAREVRLDGRRLGMMYRGLLGLEAARRALGRTGTRGSEALAAGLRLGLSCTLPHPATGEEVGRLVLEATHGHAVRAVLGNDRPLLPTHDPLAGACALRTGHACFEDEDVASVLVTRLETAIDQPRDEESGARGGAALVLLAGDAPALSRLPAEARHRLLSRFLDAAVITAGRMGESVVELPPLESPLPEAVREAVRRVARHVAIRLADGPVGTIDAEPLAGRMARLLEEGGAR